jgi:hypothetical protein
VADFYRKGYTGAGESAFARSLVRKRTRSGWKWRVNFHNHPFDFQNSYGDLGGVLVPSEADIANYQTSRPPEAWITNGLNTVVFQPGAYQRLEP